MTTRHKSKIQEYIVDVLDESGKKIDKLELNKKIFDGRFNTALLHDALLMYGACKRQGNASTKNRGEVRGGGKKPWRQKGTGRARFGSIRNPIWRGGGVAFGPRPRSFSYSMPQKTRLKAVQSALNIKLADKQFFVVDAIKLDEPKTKKLVQILNKLKISGKTLIISDKLDNNIKTAARNLNTVKIVKAENVSSDDILRHERLLLTKGAVLKLTKRLQA